MVADVYDTRIFASERPASFRKIGSADSWLISGCAMNLRFRIPLSFLERFGMALDGLKVTSDVRGPDTTSTPG